MWIRVRNKITGHQFDVPEEAFNDETQVRVPKYKPSRHPRRPKFKRSLKAVQAATVTPDTGGEEES